MGKRRGHREGGIGQRKDGLWYGTVDLGRDHGRRERKWLYGKTRKEVHEKLQAALEDQRQGRPVKSGRQTVGAYLENWIAGAGSRVRGSTSLRYAQLVRVHLTPRLGHIQLAKLTPTDCDKAYAEMVSEGLAPRTAGHAHRVLGRALHDAEVAGLVARNVVRLVQPPRVPHEEMRTLTGEQARALLQASHGDRLTALYHVALASGARQGELLALRWSDVDLDGGKIRIQRTQTRTAHGLEMGDTKTPSSRRTVPIGGAVGALRAHRLTQIEERLAAGPRWTDTGLVFTDKEGGSLDGVSVTRSQLYPLLKRAGLPWRKGERIRFHDLRHTAATLMLENGVHPRVVAERLGHATPSLVMNLYGHVTERMQAAATAAMDAALYS